MDPHFITADTNDAWEVTLHCRMCGSFTLGNTYPTSTVSLPHTTRIPDYTSVKTFNLKE